MIKTKTRLSHEQALGLLKKHIGPIPTEDHQLKQDLWPRMLRRFDEKTNSISFFDWVLLAATIVIVMLWPQSIAGLFYQL